MILKYDGHFEVMKKISAIAYRLKLLNRLRIHPLFHMSFLKPFHEDQDLTKVQQSCTPPSIWKQIENEIYKIFHHWIISN